MMLRFFVWLFKRKGWVIEGIGIPKDVKKAVIIAAPHTSNWDFVYSLAGLKLYGINFNYMAKKELFKWPFKKLFTSLGGIPVERSKNTRMVDAIIQLFSKRAELKLMISSEGSRKRVEKWKTGFYYVALGAKVPIFMAYLDYERKVAGMSEAFFPTGDLAKDAQTIKNYYSGRVAKFPELFNIDAIKLEEK